MPTLLFTLRGPLQSWGTDSKFSTRKTLSFPTKSGVLGLIAASQGIRRTDPLEDLLTLRFGVRIDQPGQLLKDFHTALPTGQKQSQLSDRYYLSDAIFLAALEHPDQEFLEGLQLGLEKPTFPLYLGRRSCPPAGPLLTTIFDGPLESALHTEPWKAHQNHQRNYHTQHVTLDAYVDAKPGEEIVMELNDMPVSFDSNGRKYSTRAISYLPDVKLENPNWSAHTTTSHDPLGLLEDVEQISYNLR